MKHGKREIKNKNSNQNKNNQQPAHSNPSPINKSKIQSLAEVYNELPPNSFSKLTITLCFIGIFAVIIISFVFLYFGIDSSSITQYALIAFTAELFVLGAKTIFTKEQTVNDIVFEQIKKDINDGKYYDENGKVVFSETGGNVTIDNSITNNYGNDDEVQGQEDIEANIEQENEIILENTTQNALKNVVISTSSNTSTPKKRGRPKKSTKKEEKIEENKIETDKTDKVEDEEELTSAGWLDEDMSD